MGDTDLGAGVIQTEVCLSMAEGLVGIECCSVDATSISPAWVEKAGLKWTAEGAGGDGACMAGFAGGKLPIDGATPAQG